MTPTNTGLSYFLLVFLSLNRSSLFVLETRLIFCRHVVLPPEVAKLLPKNRLLSENEWRAIGVQQSRGWVHYAIHRPEPHIMLFRRPLNYQQENQQPVQAAAK
ncbi:Cyclin-dependent kinases regulatory subunit 2 [Nymphaea thermarum]|nr:Cyclin-dependent kinases regulatory subunit 2 [Nymphaea thermarum]